jgi:tetratricopeptide (TPR) repeat protein
MGSLLFRVVLGAGVAAAVMLRGPAIVEAQPGPQATAPSAADKQAAKKLVDDGIAAMDAKDYDKAIELYQKAFVLVAHPLLIFNVGQAHRLSGRLQQAAQFYERYLQLDPNGNEAAAARAHLATIKAAGATKPVEASKPAGTGREEPTKSTESPDPAGAAPSAPAQESQRAPAPEVAAVRALEPEEPRRVDTVASPGRTLRITGLVLGGVGLASLAVGGYFGLRVRNLEADARDEVTRAMNQGEPPPTQDLLQEKYGKDGDAAERNQFISYGIAGGMLVGGAVIYWLGYRKARLGSTTAWAPVINAGFAGIAVSGSIP